MPSGFDEHDVTAIQTSDSSLWKPAEAGAQASSGALAEQQNVLRRRNFIKPGGPAALQFFSSTHGFHHPIKWRQPVEVHVAGRAR